MGEVLDFLDNAFKPETRESRLPKNLPQLNFEHGYNKYLSDTQYNKLYNKQKGKCAICGVHQQKLNKRLYVDHDHETNKIRGLLCGHCNSTLGFARDNIDVLESAIKYLKKYE